MPPPMLPKLNRKRALFVLTKIDEILAWERRSETERDTRFVELGCYLCEVRAGQYWRLEMLKSFDEFLERRFPESRRKAYYLMSIHEQAIETAALMLGTDKSRGYCLEMICADFLAGASLDGEDSSVLLQSMSRFFKFLPGEQRKAFLNEVTEQAL